LLNQEPALFATTILENILYGKLDVTMAEVGATTTSADSLLFFQMATTLMWVLFLFIF
jgi:ABC-type multidrug transport system fused ATPase/permease subunit